ncbi:unnamed protein product [Protopolystoma xenopodis]|uniref:Uncharacterized protein n=1 Tax=Protopolystoma xenopodis TaxID=117903 RepID=A0A448XQS8_9PLAT|nr:unnamed protein product [Protopolystoma xenopodis]
MAIRFANGQPKRYENAESLGRENGSGQPVAKRSLTDAPDVITHHMNPLGMLHTSEMETGTGAPSSLLMAIFVFARAIPSQLVWGCCLDNSWS